MATSEFRIEMDSAVLVIVDIQERISAAMPAEVLQRMVKSVEIMWDAATVLEIPVIVTEQYPKGLGGTLPSLEERVVESGIQKVSKVTFSCCGEPAFVERLESTGRKDVILCGEETHVCLLQTALDLLERGFQVFVPGDAVCSREALNWQLGLDEMRQAGCVVSSVESLLFRMLGRAGTEQFKAISRLVK
jgi:nicotinamidase-related amidase